MRSSKYSLYYNPEKVDKNEHEQKTTENTLHDYEYIEPDINEHLQGEQSFRSHAIDDILGVGNDDHCHPHASKPIKDMFFCELYDVIITYDEARNCSPVYLQPGRDINEIDFLLDELSREGLRIIETIFNQYINGSPSLACDEFKFKKDLAALNESIEKSIFLSSHEGMKKLFTSVRDLLSNAISINDILGITIEDLKESEKKDTLMVSNIRSSHCHPFGYVPIKKFGFYQLFSIITNYDKDRKKSQVYLQPDCDENAIDVLLDKLAQKGLSIFNNTMLNEDIFTNGRSENLDSIISAISTSQYLNAHPGMQALRKAGWDLCIRMCNNYNPMSNPLSHRGYTY